MVLAGSFTLLLIFFRHFKYFFRLNYEKIDWLGFYLIYICTNTNFLNCWNKLFHTNQYPSRGCWDVSLSHLNCCDKGWTEILVPYIEWYYTVLPDWPIKWITTLFVEQPRALIGCAYYTSKITADLVESNIRGEVI